MTCRSRLRLSAATALALAAIACTGGNTTGSNVLVVSDVEISPNGAGLIVGQTQQFTATPKTSGGTPVSGREVRWGSSNGAVASVSTTGLVTAISVGTTTISATVDKVTGGVTVTVSPVPVASVTVEPGQASILVGEAVQLNATPKDDKGNALSGRPVTWESDNPAIATVTSAGSVIGINQGSTTIRATAEGKVGSAAITVNPRPASRLGFLVQPSNGTAGQPLAAVKVAVQDDIGRTVTTATSAITLALSDNPGNATLGGTLTVNAVDGVATFADLVLNRVAAGYTLRATSGQLSPGISNPFAIGAGAATALAIKTQPSSSAQSGVPLVQQPAVQLKDAGGNDVSQAGVVVTASLVGSGGTLGGTLTATTGASGAAAFTNLAISGPAGAYTLRFTAPGLTEIQSQTVTLTGGTATQLAIVTQPSASAASGAPFAVQPVLQLKDANGNDAAAQGVIVTATLASGTGTLGGVLTATTDANGRAAFSNLQITGPVGTYTISFGAPGISSVISAPITLGAGGAASLEILIQPSALATNGIPLPQQPKVQLRDAGGNPVTAAGVTVTAAVVGGGAGLTGVTSLVTASDGTVTFSNLALLGAVGSYNLVFSSPGLASATSVSITLTAGPAARLVIGRQPSAGGQSGVPLTIQPQVQVADQSGNPVAQAGVAVTASLASGAGSLGGTLTVTTNAAGLAAFTDIAITGPAGTYTIGFAAPGLTGVVSSVVGLGAGVATQLTIITQPSASAQSGVVFPQQPVVQLSDASNNPVSQAGVVVTAAIATGGGSLLGTLTATTNASGQATFTNLAISGLVGARTLQFTASGLASAVSAGIAVSAGPAAQLALTTQPSSSAQNTIAFAQQPVVQVQDAAGNPVAQAGTSVAASIASGGGTLGGTATVTTDANGAAAFTGLSITGTVGNRTLQFSAAGLASAVSGTIALGAGPATQLALTTQPSATAQSGVAFAQQPVVQVEDVSGNAVSQSAVQVTAAIASGGGTLGGTTTVTTNASGVAAFTNLSITGSAGSRTLSFTSVPVLTPVTSGTITLGAGAATQLAVTTQPSPTAQSGVVFAQQPAIQLLDGSGNPVAQSGVTVTASIASGGGTLGGTVTASTNASGVASFTNLSITGIIGSRTLQFAATGLTSATSNSISVTAGPMARLAVAVQPSPTASSGVAFPQQPVIQLQDGAGNSVTTSGVAVTAAIASGSGATLDGTTIALTDALGRASFTNLALVGTSGNYTLGFTSGSLTGTVSNTIALGAGAPSVLSITTQPSSTVQNGQVFPQQPVIQLRDASNNPVAQSGVVVSVTIYSGGGTLGGTLTATTNASGVATFSGLSITGTTGTRTLIFAASGYVSVTSGNIAVTAGAPTALQITTQPSSTAQSGVAFPQQPVIQLVDQSGNLVSQSGVNVTATIASGGGTLGGTTTMATNASGVAGFADLAISGTVGSRTLAFAATGLTGVTSNTISLSAGPASQLSITTQPSASAQSGVVFAQQPAIQLRDGAGNAVSQSGVVVTAAIASGTGTLGGTITATTNASGVASFTDLSISGTAGTFTLQFTATGLAAATSGSITLTAGAATALSITTQPSSTAQSGVAFAQQPVIQLRDGGGNPVSQSGVVVTAAIASGTGTLGGTLTATTNASGVASFTNLSISGAAGTFTLQFTATGLAAVTSNTITMSAGPAATLTVLTQPSGTAASGTVFAQQPVVRVQDSGGNNVSGAVVTASIGSGSPAGATLLGTVTATSAANGRATFTNLAISGPVGTYTLQFSATGTTPVSSNSILLSAGTATKLGITTQPSPSAQSGVTFPQQPALQVQDAFGNAVSQSGTVVTAAIATGAGTLGGTLTATTNGSGAATFTDLMITGLTGDRTLGFSAGGLTAATSSTVTVAAGPASQLTITTQPGTTTANSGQSLVPQPAIQLRDGAGNAVSQSGVTVTATIATSPGGTPSLANATAQTDANGLATFSNLSVTGTTGSYTLAFNATGVTGVTSNVFTLGAGSASQIAITTPPSNTARSGIALATAPVVQVKDAGGNPVSGVTITASLNGGGSLSGTTSGPSDGSGTVTFTGLTISGIVGTKTLTFTAPGPLATSSGNITLSAGAASQVTITTQPGTTSAVNGQSLSPQPVVQLRDAAGNAVDSAGATVTAAVATGGGTVTAGATATTDAAGTATFSGLTVTGTAGSYTLQFTAGALTPATSNAFTLTAGAATALQLITDAPANAVNGAAFSQAPVIKAVDGSGNAVQGVSITVAIASGTGTLGGTLTRSTGSDGQATFSGLSIVGTAGTFTLSFTAGALSVGSGSITLAAGAATQMVISTQPGTTATSGSPLSPQPVIQFLDSGGNLATSATGTVTASLVGSGGSLGGTVGVSAVAGVATFTDLVITGPGTYQLQFDSGSLTAVQSVSITVN